MSGQASAGSVFITGLSSTGKTELRRSLDRSGAIVFTRKSYLWRSHCHAHGDLDEPGARSRLLAAVSAAAEGSLLPADTPLEQVIGWDSDDPDTDYHRVFARIHRHAANRRGFDRWGLQEDAIERWAEEILDSLPDAHIIHMIRHPVDRLGRVRPSRVHTIERERRRWRTSARRAALLAQRYPRSYRPVRYEDLMADPTGTVREICEAVGIPFSHEMTTELEAPAPGSRPIWTPLMTRGLGPELSRWGYSTTGVDEYLVRTERGPNGE